MSLLVSVPSKIKRTKLISSQKKKIQELEWDIQRESEGKKEEKIESEESELPLE